MPKDKELLEKNHEIIGSKTVDALYGKITSHIDDARENVQRTVDVEMIKAYWLIGRDIIQEEQSGELRAEYGRSILKQLSKKLQQRYKRGFSVQTLEKARKFYVLYQKDTIGGKSPTLSGISETPAVLNLNLSWSHYVELMTVKRDEARDFYALEASQNKWTVRELRRQMDSFLYDRLAKAKDKGQVLQLARKGQEINKPEDAIKEPLVLEFLGVPEPHKLSETKLESALINNLQNFLLELGKGFSFVARQKRLSFDNSHFYADLVFYHVILKCYIIIDLKTHELTHADLGQMQLYVNYFDMEIKQHDDNPTIGLVLCTEKREEMAKYMLGEKSKTDFREHLPISSTYRKRVGARVKT